MTCRYPGEDPERGALVITLCERAAARWTIGDLRGASRFFDAALSLRGTGDFVDQ